MAKPTRFLDPARLAGREPPVPNLRRDLGRRAATVSLLLLSFGFLEYRAWISERFAIFSDGGDWTYSSYRDPLLGLTEAEAALEVFPGLTLGDLARLLRNPATYGIDRSFFRAFMAVPELRNALKGFRASHNIQALRRNLRVPALRDLLAKFSGEQAFERRIGGIHSARSQQSMHSEKSAAANARQEPNAAGGSSPAAAGQAAAAPTATAQASFALDPLGDPARILDAAASIQGVGVYSYRAAAFAADPFRPGSISREEFLGDAARRPATPQRNDPLDAEERTSNKLGPASLRIEPRSNPADASGHGIDVHAVAQQASEFTTDPCHGLCEKGFVCAQLTAPPVSSWSCVQQ